MVFVRKFSVLVGCAASCWAGTSLGAFSNCETEYNAVDTAMETLFGKTSTTLVNNIEAWRRACAAATTPQAVTACLTTLENIDLELTEAGAELSMFVPFKISGLHKGGVLPTAEAANVWRAAGRPLAGAAAIRAKAIAAGTRLVAGGPEVTADLTQIAAVYAAAVQQSSLNPTLNAVATGELTILNNIAQAINPVGWLPYLNCGTNSMGEIIIDAGRAGGGGAGQVGNRRAMRWDTDYLYGPTMPNWDEDSSEMDLTPYQDERHTVKFIGADGSYHEMVRMRFEYWLPGDGVLDEIRHPFDEHIVLVPAGTKTCAGMYASQMLTLNGDCLMINAFYGALGFEDVTFPGRINFNICFHENGQRTYPGYENRVFCDMDFETTGNPADEGLEKSKNYVVHHARKDDQYPLFGVPTQEHTWKSHLKIKYTTRAPTDPCVSYDSPMGRWIYNNGPGCNGI